MNLKKKIDLLDGPIPAFTFVAVITASLIVICGFSSAIVIREIGAAVETTECHSNH